MLVVADDLCARDESMAVVPGTLNKSATAVDHRTVANDGIVHGTCSLDETALSVNLPPPRILHWVTVRSATPSSAGVKKR